MIFPFEKQAMLGQPMPDDLALESALAYQCMRNLYRDIRSGTVKRDQAISEKRLIERSYHENHNAITFGEKCRNHSVKLWAKIEAASSAYQKNRTIENADRLIDAIYGVGIPKKNGSSGALMQERFEIGIEEV